MSVSTLTGAKQAAAARAEFGSICIRGGDAPQRILAGQEDAPKGTAQQDVIAEPLDVDMLLRLSPQRIRLAEAMREVMLGTLEDLLEAELGARHDDPKNEFDRLLALTLTLYECEFWLHNHEEGAFDHLLSELGQRWTSVLAMSDAQLGIPARDSFTRAGTITLLEQFQALVDDAGEGLLDFSFSASA
jgi:hypothetical protein